MNKFVYVVSLAGKHVTSKWSIQYAIKSMDNIAKARTMIKNRYGIEFEEQPSFSCNWYWQFNNITDDRDIKLIVEHVDIL